MGLDAIRADVQASGREASAADFRQLTRALVSANGDYLLAAERAHGNVSSRVEAILRSAVVAGTTSDATWASALLPYRVASNEWLAGLRTLSVFDRMLPDTHRVPLNQLVAIVTATASGAAVGQAMLKPLSSLTLSGPTLTIRKATAVISISSELAQFSTGVASALFDAELTQAVAAATDQQFVAALAASVTPTASAGATVANAITDLDVLLAAVQFGAGARLYHILHPADCKKLATKASTAGGRAFPGLGVLGGEIVPGVTTIVSDQIDAATALLVDASQLICGSETIVFDASRQAALQFDSAPDSPPVSGTLVESLWQSGRVAMKAERYYGYEIGRAACVAALSGVAY